MCVHFTLAIVQVSEQIVSGKFPVNQELAFELAALMAQVGFQHFFKQQNYVFFIAQWWSYPFGVT